MALDQVQESVTGRVKRPCLNHFGLHQTVMTRKCRSAADTNQRVSIGRLVARRSQTTSVGAPALLAIDDERSWEQRRSETNT